jgi:hypothetical protein
MSSLSRVVGFVLGLAAIFALALVVGRQVGPVDEETDAAAAHSEAGDAGHGQEGDEAASPDHGAETVELPGGLMVSSGGYTLRLDDPVTEAGSDRRVSFVIEGTDGPVTAYDVEHEKKLHLIAVRRDFSGFQHVHPTMAADGRWTTTLDLTSGQWRVFADFKARGAEPLTLGADLTVPGRVAPARERGTTREVVVDGYSVRLEGDLVAGEHSELTLTVSREGRPVRDLQPYLGAYGHLVALRGGDLAYLHVHPEGEPGDGTTEPGPEIEFVAEVPSAGDYHLYLDFRHRGVVRTARFALDTTEAPHAQ